MKSMRSEIEHLNKKRKSMRSEIEHLKKRRRLLDAAAPEAEEAVDESWVESKDIDLVMTQTGISRFRAVKLLKENDGDFENAIVSLVTT
jgi:nascent polypeptide-associated complex subunit alpha